MHQFLKILRPRFKSCTPHHLIFRNLIDTELFVRALCKRLKRKNSWKRHRDSPKMKKCFLPNLHLIFYKCVGTKSSSIPYHASKCCHNHLGRFVWKSFIDWAQDFNVVYNCITFSSDVIYAVICDVIYDVFGLTDDVPCLTTFLS